MNQRVSITINCTASNIFRVNFPNWNDSGQQCQEMGPTWSTVPCSRSQNTLPQVGAAMSLKLVRQKVPQFGFYALPDTWHDSSISILITIQRILVFLIEKNFPIDQLQTTNREIIAQLSYPSSAKWKHRVHRTAIAGLISKINSDRVAVVKAKKNHLEKLGYLSTCLPECLPAGSGMF